MSKLERLSTDGLDQKKAKEFWADHVSDACHGVRCDFDASEHFAAHTEFVDMGFGKLTNFWVTSISAERTPHHITRDGLDLVCLTLVRQGGGRITSDGYSLDWQAGDVYCGTASTPFKVEMGGPVEFTTFYFDQSWLQSIIPLPTSLFLSELTKKSGWGSALAGMLSELRPNGISQLALPPGAVAENIVGVLSLAAGANEPSHRTNSRSLFERFRTIMKDRLHESELSPSQFALDNGVSVRTLHSVFMKANTTFMSELLSLRIDRSMGLLADKRLAQITISEISSMVGFNSPEHFSTRFRKHNGISPNAYRSLLFGKLVE